MWICSHVAASGTIWAPPQSDPTLGAQKARKNVTVYKKLSTKECFLMQHMKTQMFLRFVENGSKMK